ncbi:MAG: hypothetical protein QW356_01000 [Candidatus Hadarchaeales archaeon]
MKWAVAVVGENIELFFPSSDIDFDFPGERKRTGWIVPANPLKLILFFIIRFILRRKGREWTRRWKGKWFLVIPFDSREEAVKAEIEFAIWREHGYPGYFEGK